MRRLLLRVAVGAVLASLPVLSYPNRVPAGHAGVPGESNPPCGPCHTVSLNPPGGSVSLQFADGLVYQAGKSQRVTVRINDPDAPRRFGFQAAVRTLTNVQAGSFAATAGTAVVQQGALAYVNQTASATTYTFDWTPPFSAADTVRFYVAGLAARGTRDSHVYTASVDLRPAGAAPALRAEDPVVNAAGFRPAIAPGAWITLFGQNLAPAGVSRTWNADTEIVNSKLPQSLDGVGVTVNGRAAAVYFISTTQINAQAPDDDATGPVEVKVTTPQGSATAAASLSRFAPGLFSLAPESGRYAAAVHADGTLAGKPGLYGGNPVLRAARAGDVLQFYGTGFGPTTPGVPAGVTVASPAPLADLAALRIRIGSAEARILWAGLVSAGLYQFNLEAPALAAGDHAVVAEIAGQSSQPGLYLTIAE